MDKGSIEYVVTTEKYDIIDAFNANCDRAKIVSSLIVGPSGAGTVTIYGTGPVARAELDRLKPIIDSVVRLTGTRINLTRSNINIRTPREINE